MTVVTNKLIKVALLVPVPYSIPGWSFSHNAARIQLQEKFAGRIESTTLVVHDSSTSYGDSRYDRTNMCNPSWELEGFGADSRLSSGGVLGRWTAG